MKRRRIRAGLPATVGLAVLTLVALSFVSRLLIGILYPYPSMSENFPFSSYGFWGESPAEISDRARHSSDVGEVYAALDALALIGLHYDNRADTMTRALGEIKQIYCVADKQWAQRPCEHESRYTPFDPWHDYSVKWHLSLGQSVKLAVFASVSSVRDVAHHEDLPSLQAECDRYLLEIRPPPASSLHKVWLLNTKSILEDDPDALMALRDAVECDSRMAAGDESGEGN